MSDILSRYNEVSKTIPNDVQLVAVSKTKPISDIEVLYEAGHRHFGENKVQELVDKFEEMPKDIQWHFIGHLQRNKVKYIAPFVHLIHGIDSVRLLKEVNKRAKNADRVIDVLLQVHIAREDTKFGFSFEELNELFESNALAEFQNIQVVGFMGMATNTKDTSKIRSEFQELHNYFETQRNTNARIQILSMGMSGDYQIALEEGSTTVRLGSTIFGARNYG